MYHYFPTYEHQLPVQPPPQYSLPLTPPRTPSSIEDKPSRSVLVLGLPKDASPDSIRRAFKRNLVDNIKGFYFRILKELGAVTLVFHETHQAHDAIKSIRSSKIIGRYLSARPISDSFPFVTDDTKSDPQADVIISILGPHGFLTPKLLYEFLFDCFSFCVIDRIKGIFLVRFDSKIKAFQAVNQLNNCFLFDAKLRVIHALEAAKPPSHSGTPPPCTPTGSPSLSSISEGAALPPTPSHGRRGSTGSAFELPSPKPTIEPSSPTRTLNRRNSEEDLRKILQEYAENGKTPVIYAFDPPSPKISFQRLGDTNGEKDSEKPAKNYEQQRHRPSTPSNSYPPHSANVPSTEDIKKQSPDALSFQFPSVNQSSLHWGGTPPSFPPERNRVDVDKIARGLDTRTTIMLKNIPNKLTDADLMRFIDTVCPRTYDFLYLRIDFQNHCNVGYAFVNFIRVEDLLFFAKEKLDKKWGLCKSQKVLQMSYANFQGKEALVEKFKNSCIMEERESWRPKIFFSSGPNVGRPEQFPPPNNLARARRSGEQRHNGLRTNQPPSFRAVVNSVFPNGVAPTPPFYYYYFPKPSLTERYYAYPQFPIPSRYPFYPQYCL